MQKPQGCGLRFRYPEVSIVCLVVSKSVANGLQTERSALESYPVNIEEGCVVFGVRPHVEESEFCTDPFALFGCKFVANLLPLLAIQTIIELRFALDVILNSFAVNLGSEIERYRGYTRLRDIIFGVLHGVRLRQCVTLDLYFGINLLGLALVGTDAGDLLEHDAIGGIYEFECSIVESL